MSTLAENVEKVKNAHAALKAAISSKGVTVPENVKLSDMPDLIKQIQSGGTSGEIPKPTNQRLCFAYDTSASIVIPKMMVVDTTATTDLSYHFYNCKALKSLTLPDGFGQNATNLTYCFYNCSQLTQLSLPNGFGQNATNLTYCFYYSSSITSLSLPARFGQNATNLNYCFGILQALKTLTLPDGFGRNATSLDYCFYYCSSLTTLVLPDGFGQNATKTSRCFYSCSALTTITGNPNFKVSIDLSRSPNLTHDSLMVIINGLQTIETTQTLTIGSTNLEKLSEEDKKVASDKGWTLA